MEPFKITYERTSQVPIIISVPHCGTAFPKDIAGEFRQDLIAQPDDTDWFVDQLYDFAPDMGIRMISATISRWVIDLNRDPQSKPLYTDGRLITGLCPVKSFKDESLYIDARESVHPDEVMRRVEEFYSPYHQALQTMLQEGLEKFGKILLWDCHSIRRTVPTIHPDPFPDLILGDNDGSSAGEFLSELVSKNLITSGYSFENNFLFKGGYITRTYGNPDEHQHALQLEMVKRNYMDDSETEYDATRAEKMRDHLKRVFEKLITVMSL